MTYAQNQTCATFLLCGLLLSACAAPATSDSPDLVQATDVYVEPDWQARYDWGQPPLEETCQTATNRLLHLSSWPGLGLGILVGVKDELGQPLAELPADRFELATLWGIPIATDTAPVTIQREYDLFLLADAASLSSADRASLAEVVESLPETADAALYVACDGAVQAVGFGTGRRQVLAALNDESYDCSQGESAWDVIAAAILDVEHIGGPTLPAIRNLVVVGGTLPAPPEPLSFAGSPVSLLRVGPVPTPAPAFPLTIVDAVEALPEALQSTREGLHMLAACPGLEAEEAVTLTSTDGAVCPFLVPEGPGELEEMACDEVPIAANSPAFPARVELLFSEDERAIYDGFAEAKDQTEFSLRIKLGDAPAVTATAHLHGQTSLGCERKSYTVNLKGNRGRHLLPGSAMDEFYLISMCKDDRYFQQYTANLLAARHGLFPLRFGFVEVLLDGQTRGVYLLLEKTKEALLDELSRVRTVIRRRFDPGDNLPELHYPDSGDIEGPEGAAYFELAKQSESLAGEELVAEMERRMDFSLFLRFLAFQTLLGNGDYVDEVIFYSTEALRAGEKREWFQLMAWDMDDLYSACHHSGKHAMEDSFELLFCAEGFLEKAVMVDSAVYARFIDELEYMMAETLTEEDLDEALARTAADLLPFFDDPDVCAAMTVLVSKNPEAATPEGAKADIQSHMETLKGQYVTRRDKLKARIEAYHASRTQP